MFAAANLLHLVRQLIDYGRELASTLRQRSAADPYFTRCAFGTSDLALILARITRGLHLASALEARLVRRPMRPDAKPRPVNQPPQLASCTARSPARRTVRANPDPAHLPTPEEQIAARVRRQPIGAAIADLCRDLGITPSHPLWRQVQMVIVRYGGSLARLAKDLIERAFPAAVRSEAPDVAPVWSPSSPTLASTGPP